MLNSNKLVPNHFTVNFHFTQCHSFRIRITSCWTTTRRTTRTQYVSDWPKTRYSLMRTRVQNRIKSATETAAHEKSVCIDRSMVGLVARWELSHCLFSFVYCNCVLVAIVNAARRWIVITTIWNFLADKFIRFADGLSMLETRSNSVKRVLSDWFLIWCRVFAIRHLENVFTRGGAGLRFGAIYRTSE